MVNENINSPKRNYLIKKAIFLINKYNTTKLWTALAVVVSISALFANGLPNFLKGASHVVYTEKKLQISQTLGRFFTYTAISIRNTGGSDINLLEGKYLVELENGQKIEFFSDSFTKPSSYDGLFKLRDVVIKPGESWSGNMYFEELPNRAILEENENFIEEHQRVNAIHLRRAEQYQLTAFARFAEAYIRKKDIIDIEKLNEIIEKTPTKCSLLPNDIQQKFTKLTTDRANRLIKGHHKSLLSIKSVNGDLIKREESFILFERDIQKLLNPDFLQLMNCGETNTALPVTSVKIEMRSPAEK